MDRQLPDAATALFRERPEGFIAARDSLAKQLHNEGRDDDAATVKALRKPTLVLWALNQLADREPQDVDALLDAGRELRAAQQAALSAGGGAERLRRATTDRRDAVLRLSKAASAALQEAGRGATQQLDAVIAALEAAAVDEEASQRLRAGTLEAVPAPASGFGDVFGLETLPGGATERGGRKPTTTKKVDVARLTRDRDAADKALKRERDAIARLKREVSELRARLEKAETDLAAAEAKASAAELDAKRAERALRQAER